MPAPRKPGKPPAQDPDEEILRSAVEDAQRFLFNRDLAPQLEPPPATSPPAKRSAKSSSAAAKDPAPHYHAHRARLRARFVDVGPQSLADYELLEMLLFRVVPRRDTKPLAKALLARFGDLAAVLGAPLRQIEAVEGAGPAVALELKLVQATMERAERAELRRRPVISSWSQLIKYCRTAMAQQSREQFRVLFLDVKNHLIADEVLAEGTIDHAPVYPREVARRALEHGAAAAILVHNHPSGDPRPSSADIAITREVVAAAKAVGVVVHDHIVIGRDGIASLKNLQLM